MLALGAIWRYLVSMETFWPAILSLAAAAMWGLGNHVQRIALDDTDPLTGAFVSVATMAGLCWIAAPFLVDASWWWTRSTLIFAIMGIFFPALGQRFQIASVGLVGPSLTASLSAFTPVIAVSIGVLFLGEEVGAQSLVGLALMVAGLALATWSPRGIKRGWPIWAILVPLSAALVRGISQPGLKWGMEGVPSPFFALLVTGTMSTLVLGLMLWPRHRQGRTRTGAGLRWFVANGVINGAGIFALNAALSLGALTLVSPLSGTVPLWALAFGAIIFRRETLGLKHLAIALCVVIGGALILTR
ncbi:EamA family transporter [Maritimibacter sp. DP07]|uniref:EamA family transporter n=2 Tax=Maritimibacter harenae TaxID=2606218 RepID=A0A845M2T5_9RHOB|nr:EamA family transporter [Maritimibacter harenae]